MDNDQKRAILTKIKGRLRLDFGNQVLSAIVYGSTLGDDYCVLSDFDILVIFEWADYKTFQKLRKIKLDFAKHGIPIDFNSHIFSDLPMNRKDVFWHNNRGIYVQKELALYGEILFGKKYFRDINLDHEKMLEEAVKTISSLNYQVRKMLTNKKLTTENRIIIIKWCIYGTIYILAALDIFPKSRGEALTVFNEKFHPKINPEIFLQLKTSQTHKINQEHLRLAYDYLVYLDQLIFKIYKENSYERIQS